MAMLKAKNDQKFEIFLIDHFENYDFFSKYYDNWDFLIKFRIKIGMVND